MLRYGIKICLAVGLATLGVGPAFAEEEFKARLDGFFEIGALNNSSGAILTNGTGKLRLIVDKNSARYSLTIPT